MSDLKVLGMIAILFTGILLYFLPFAFFDKMLLGFAIAVSVLLASIPLLLYFKDL